MSDGYLLLTPILMLGVLALVRFVGCDLIFTVDPRPEFGPPENVVVRAGNHEVRISWDPIEKADEYVVKRSETSGGPYDSLAVPNLDTTFRDTNVTNGVTYFYAVAGRE